MEVSEPSADSSLLGYSCDWRAGVGSSWGNVAAHHCALRLCFEAASKGETPALVSAYYGLFQGLE